MVKLGSNKTMQEKIACCKKYGLEPFEVLAEAMNNKKLAYSVRIDCAKALLPYMHRRRLPENEDDMEIVGKVALVITND